MLGSHCIRLAVVRCDVVGIRSGTFNMMNQEVLRHYRVYVPESYKPGQPSPLLLWFHGWGGNENELIADPSVRALADQHGYILVTPRGLGGGEPDNKFSSWSFSGSNTGLDGDGLNPNVAGDSEAICDTDITPDYIYPSCKESATTTCAWTHCQTDDVDFAMALVKEISSKLCVDPERVFASGGSNGGMLTWELGQNPKSANTFRAIAPVIGLPHRGYLSGPAKSGDLPVLLIIGALDDTVPPGDWEDSSFTTTSNDNDRFYYTGATAITRVWAAAHQCDVSQPAKSFDAGAEQADCRSYCDAGNGWPDVLDCRAAMGHDYGLNWSFALVLDFLDAHSQ